MPGQCHTLAQDALAVPWCHTLDWQTLALPVPAAGSSSSPDVMGASTAVPRWALPAPHSLGWGNPAAWPCVMERWHRGLQGPPASLNTEHTRCPQLPDLATSSSLHPFGCSQLPSAMWHQGSSHRGSESSTSCPSLSHTVTPPCHHLFPSAVGPQHWEATTPPAQAGLDLLQAAQASLRWELNWKFRAQSSFAASSRLSVIFSMLQYLLRVHKMEQTNKSSKIQ